MDKAGPLAAEQQLSSITGEGVQMKEPWDRLWFNFQHGLGAWGWKSVVGLFLWWGVIILGITWIYGLWGETPEGWCRDGTEPVCATIEER